MSVHAGALPPDAGTRAPGGGPVAGRRARWRSIDPALLATMGGAAIVIAIVLRRALLGEVLFRRDVHLMWYTQVEALVRAVTAGEWPLWNPDIGFGQPLWADANTQVLYPPTWLNLLLRPWRYYALFVAGHLLLAAAGARALGRGLGLRPHGAAAAGLLWVASGPLLSASEVWNQLAGAAWMPWALLAGVRTLQTGRTRWAVAWGACVAAQVLAGSLEAALLGAAGIIGYAIAARGWRSGAAEAVSGSSPPRLPEQAMVLARGVGLAMVVALGLCAGQWLPSLFAAAESGRAHLAEGARGFWSVHPIGLVQLFFPLAADDLRLRPQAAAILFGALDPLLPSLYLGLATVPLAGAALAGPRRRPALWLLAGFAGALGLALGEHAPFQALLNTMLPPLRALRYPVKAMTAAGLCWALLGGLGVEVWWSPPAAFPRRRWVLLVAAPVVVLATLAVGGVVAIVRWPDAIASKVIEPGSPLPFDRLLAPARARLGGAALAGLAMGSLAFFRPRASVSARRRVAAAAVAVAVADLTVAHAGLVSTAPRALFTYRTPVLEAARPPDHGRLYAYDYFAPGRSAAYLGRLDPFKIVRAPEGWSVPAATALSMRLSLFPPSAAPWGIAGSFDNDTPGIAPHRAAGLRDALLGRELTPGHARLLALGAVSRVAARHERGLEGLPLLAAADALLPEPLRVRAVPEARPRAYAVPARAATVLADDSEALAALLDPAFDPARGVVLAEADVPSGESTAPPSGFTSAVRIDHVGADRVRLEADSSEAAYVVLVDAWTPGWTARVDGREAAVHRANVAFRAIAVPAGRHAVELRYRAPGLALGLALSAATTLLAAALALPRGGAAPRASGR